MISRALEETAGIPDLSFEVGDMRQLNSFRGFDAAVSWWSSFGYYDDETDMSILRQLREALRHPGRLVLETVNATHYYSEIVPKAHRGLTHMVSEGDDLMVVHRELVDLGERYRMTTNFVVDGRVSQWLASLRLFTPSELRLWLMDAGFSSVEFVGPTGDALVPTDMTMIAVAQT